MALNLTEYKIRYPDFPKYIWDSSHPYSDAMSIKKDRRNPEHTKRPLNAFMLFAKIQREHITTHFNCNHSEISKALGKVWQDLSREEKDPFTLGAKTLVELHRREYPDYKYRPRKKGQAKEAAARTTTTPKKASARRPSVKVRCQQLHVSASSAATTSAAPPDSPMSACCLSPAAASPTSLSHSPMSAATHSPVPYSPVSIGSSSGYESELSSMPCELGLGRDELGLGHDELGLCQDELGLAQDELGLGQEDPLHGFSPEPEPEIGADLRDIEVTALGEASILNPLTMFPALGLTCDDLDDLRLNL